MLRRLERVLELRPGELARGLFLFGYLFLVIGSFTVGKAVRDALFIDEFGALLLPYADIAVAIIVGGWVAIYLRIARRTTLRTLLVGSLAFFAANCVLFWYLSHNLTAWWLTPLIYVWVGMFGVVAPTQVWTLSNYVLTTREAKRLFGFIGSGATAGWIVGGFITRIIATRFGAETTLIGMAGALLLAALLVNRVWQSRIADRDHEPAADPDSEVAGGILHSLRLVRGSPYLIAIAFVILLSSSTTAVAGWQFKAIVGSSIGGRDELAAFFGTFNFYAGIMSFALQWLVTGRLLRRFGLGVALFVVPVGLALGSVGLLLAGSLAAAVVLRGTDQVLRYAIDKPTVELLYLPISSEQTLSVKSFIDTVVWRLGDGLAGLAVLLFARWMGLGPIVMSWVTLLLIGGWCTAAWVARRQYVERLQDSIHHYRLDAERASATGLDRVATDMLAQQLGGSDPTEIVYALQLLGSHGRHAMHPAVRGLLQHQNPEVRAQAIRVLDEAGDEASESQIEKLLYDPALPVRTAALLFVAHHGRIDPLDRIEQLGAFEDFSIRAAVVSFLAQPGVTENVDAAGLLLDRMLLDEEPRTRLEAARLLELLPDHFEEQIREVLVKGEPEQVRHAIHAVGKLHKRKLVGRVIERLADAELSADAAAALALFGDRLVGTIRDYLTDPETAVAVRRQLPRVLQEIGSTAAFVALSESLLDGDTEVRYGVLTALNKLQDLHKTWPVDRRLVETVLAAEIMGHLRTYQVLGRLGAALDDPEPVADAIREVIERELERVFRLLKLLFPMLDLHSAYVGVQSRKPVVHDNAVEFLENILEPQMKALLLPLLDSDVSVSRRVELADRVLGTNIATDHEAVASLLHSDDTWLQSSAVYAIGALRLVEFASELDRLADSPDTLLRESVNQARARLRSD